MNQKLIFFIIISIIVLILGAILIYKYLYQMNSESYSATLDSYQQSIIPNDSLKPPILESSFTLHFGLNVENFYMNHLKWKHVLHKGTNITSIMDYKYWYNIETEIPKQALGIWLHPDKNSMRISCNTLVKYKHNPEEHINYDIMRSSFKENALEDTMEYLDIHDIKPNTPEYFTIVVEKQSISVFKNGQLIKTKGLLGEVVLNSGDLYRHLQNTYDGKMLDFQYFNKKLSVKKIKKLNS